MGRSPRVRLAGSGQHPLRLVRRIRRLMTEEVDKWPRHPAAHQRVIRQCPTSHNTDTEPLVRDSLVRANEPFAVRQLSGAKPLWVDSVEKIWSGRRATIQKSACSMRHCNNSLSIEEFRRC
jgi:hypothetical protein